MRAPNDSTLVVECNYYKPHNCSEPITRHVPHIVSVYLEMNSWALPWQLTLPSEFLVKQCHGTSQQGQSEKLTTSSLCVAFW